MDEETLIQESYWILVRTVRVYGLCSIIVPPFPLSLLTVMRMHSSQEHRALSPSSSQVRAMLPSK